MKMTKLAPLLILVSIGAYGQRSGNTETTALKLPIIASVNFQTIATPFQDFENNFRNIGIKLGTEVPYNRARNLLQSFNIGYYRNRLNGDGLYINSEFVYRPKIFNPISLEIKLGPGLANVFLPTQPYEPDGEGNWRKVPNHGKLALQVHGSLGIWYQAIDLNKIRLSPFIQYEIVGIVGYNRSIPALPTTLINAGFRINFKRIKQDQ